MAKEKSIYRKLSGRKRTLSGFSQLWLAPDHILLVRSTRFVEQYQRFALRDVQAIVVTEMADQSVLFWVLAATALVWMLVAIAVESMFAKGFFVATGAMVLGSSIVRIMRGRGCRCHLYTAVSRELLTPISHVARSRDFLAKVQPAIEAAQGEWSGVVARQSAVEVAPESPPVIAQSPSYLPETLFALFLGNAALILAGQQFPKAGSDNVLLTTLLAEIVILLIALVRRSKHDRRRFVYGVMLLALLGIGWDLMAASKNLFEFFTKLLDAAQRNRAAAVEVPLFLRSQAIFASSWRMAAGAIGLVTAWAERRSG